MTRQEFSDNVTGIVKLYLENTYDFDTNPQLRISAARDIDIINGSELLADIADNNEAVEEAAGAQGAEYMDSTDAQVRRNPDFVPVKKLISKGADGKYAPDMNAIHRLVGTYFD